MRHCETGAISDFQWTVKSKSKAVQGDGGRMENVVVMNLSGLNNTFGSHIRRWSQQTKIPNPPGVRFSNPQYTAKSHFQKPLCA